MNKTENKDYSPELISDAEKILEVYAKLPDNKKPMLMVIMNALIGLITKDETDWLMKIER